MQHDPNHLSARDMFLVSVLPAVAQAMIEAAPLELRGDDQLRFAAERAPEIAACARRIADAVMEERQLKPVGVK
jgi:hypothetical protein